MLQVCKKKMAGNSPNLDLVNINVHIQNLVKFYPFCSEDIEWKPNSDIHQGPQLCYKCEKNEALQSQPKSCQYYLAKFYQLVLKILSGNKILTEGQSDGIAPNFSKPGYNESNPLDL